MEQWADSQAVSPPDPRRGSVPQKQLYGVEGSTAFLECIPKSLQAHVFWTYQRTRDDPQREVGSPQLGATSGTVPC